MKGQILNQRYEVIGNLANNIRTNVYLVRHIKLNTLWVIKRWHNKNENRMQNEVNILIRLNHSCIPKIVDCFEIENDVYIVEEYFEGNTLEEMIQEKKKINEKKALEYIQKIADILDYLHGLQPNPIIYNDLKPSNIIISSNECIKLIDFESAKEKGGVSTFCLGTIGYAAPELYEGGEIHPTTDIFSLGKIMFYMLTGFKRQSPVLENHCRLSKKISFIIERCTQQNPRMRYQNIAELLRDMNN